MAFNISENASGITFAVQVAPRSRKDEIIGLQGDALKVRVTAPPVEGAANEALCRFLAKALGTPKSHVEVVAGASSRRKVVAVAGITAMTARARLLGEG